MKRKDNRGLHQSVVQLRRSVEIYESEKFEKYKLFDI